MLSRLKQMLIKEFIQVFRDRRTRFILFGPLLVHLLIFGYAANYKTRHVPTVAVDFDHSQESRELISRFSTSPYFDVQRSSQTLASLSICWIAAIPSWRYKSTPDFLRT